MLARVRLLRSYGLTTVYDVVKSTYELLKTIDDPRNSDVRYGINRFVRKALVDATPETIDAARREAPALRQLYDEGFDPVVDLYELERLPPGTLGHEYARFLNDNGIDPLETLLEGLPDLQREQLNFLQFAALRAYKLHDILHVTLGCDATVMGEVRVVSFSLAQGGGYAAAIALGVLLLHIAIKQPSQMPEAIKLAAEWHERGRQFGSHITFRFEDYWAEEIPVVRAALAGHPDRVMNGGA